MSATNQQPFTFPAKGRATAPQVNTQVRPENQLAPNTDPTIKKAMWDTTNLIYQIQNTWTPLALYTGGNTTGAPIVVPVATSSADLGTGIGLQVQLSRPGMWILGATVALNSIGDTGQTFTLTLTVNNSPVALQGLLVPPGDGVTPIVQYWQVTSLNGNENCTLKISKIAGGGTSAVLQANSALTATWQGGAQ